MAQQDHDVKVNITFRNTESTEAIKNYASEKLTHCLKKYVHHNTEAHLVLKIEKNRQIAEITFHTDGADFIAKEETSDLYSSIDSLVHSVTHQLRKHKEKITSHHAERPALD